MTYFSNFRPKLEYTSALRTSVTFTDGKKLESFEAMFVAVCFHRYFSPHISGYSYSNAFNFLIYALFVKEDINLEQLFLLMSF